MIEMYSLRTQKFSKSVKQCKIKGKEFYVPQGRMSYINLTNEIFKSKLGIYTQSKITFPDDVGWSNLYFIVFQGWLVMIRYLINSRFC